MKIDIHSHLIPESYLDEVRRPGNVYGARLEPNAAVNAPGLDAVILPGGTTYELPPGVRDPEEKIRELDRLGFDLAVISPSVTLVHYELGGPDAERHTRLVNDGMAEIQQAHGDRLRCLGLVPLQDPGSATRELDRLAADLRLGGVLLCTNVSGRNLDDPELRPVFTRAAELGLLVFVHAWFVAGAERLTRYHLINAVGNPFDATIAVASIVFSGLLDELPGLKICIAHGGGAAPFIVGRLDRAHEIRPEAREAIPRPPSDYLPRLYYDTIVHNRRALQYLVDLAGPEHVLAGSDCPFHKTDMGDPEPLAKVAALDLPSEAKRRIAGLNAAGMLGLA